MGAYHGFVVDIPGVSHAASGFGLNAFGLVHTLEPVVKVLFNFMLARAGTVAAQHPDIRDQCAVLVQGAQCTVGVVLLQQEGAASVACHGQGQAVEQQANRQQGRGFRAFQSQFYQVGGVQIAHAGQQQGAYQSGVVCQLFGFALVCLVQQQLEYCAVAAVAGHLKHMTHEALLFGQHQQAIQAQGVLQVGEYIHV
jgi:hypothetical protein